MEEKPERSLTLTLRGAVRSEGDPLGFMDPHGFDYSLDSSLDLGQLVPERVSSPSLEVDTPVPDIAVAVTTAVQDALRDAMKMQAEMLAKVLGKQSKEKALKDKDPPIL